MNPIIEKYQEYKKQFHAETWNEYPLPGGMVCVNSEQTEALVYMDGRYPTIEDGYQVNDFITETEEVLWGAMIVEFLDPKELIIVNAGEKISCNPKRPISMSGKCVCRVTFDQVWDGKQKSYFQPQ